MNEALMMTAATLAVWRLTHLLHAEAGPGQVFYRLRTQAGTGFIGQAIGCFYCLSLWVAAPVALWIADSWRDRVLLWLALSAVAILLERATGRSGEAMAANYQEMPLPEEPADARSQLHLFP
ncbi:MAG: hypothetical protein ABI605_14380 [Rhizobacter sp.]